MTDKKADGSRGSGGPQPDDVSSERGFERWLNRQLHRLYDPVLSEAVPDEIMRLLDQFDERPKPPGPNGSDENGKG